eukprot:scaffold11917_cov128-Isochrysis_galbana.AAC.11
MDKRLSLSPWIRRENAQKAPLKSAPRSMHAPVSVRAGRRRSSMYCRSSTPPSSSTHTTVIETAVPSSSTWRPGLAGLLGGHDGGGAPETLRCMGGGRPET